MTPPLKSNQTPLERLKYMHNKKERKYPLTENEKALRVEFHDQDELFIECIQLIQNDMETHQEAMRDGTEKAKQMLAQIILDCKADLKILLKIVIFFQLFFLLCTVVGIVFLLF